MINFQYNRTRENFQTCTDINFSLHSKKELEFKEFISDNLTSRFVFNKVVSLNFVLLLLITNAI